MNRYKSNKNEQEEAGSLFRDALKGVKPIIQDTYVAPRQMTASNKTRFTPSVKSKAERRRAASFAFSDLYEGHFNSGGPLRFCREDVPAFEVKRLRRGDYYPEYILDLHGLNREQTKQELSALFDTAKRELIDCVCIVHGIGSGTLKTALPNYLVQHPQVLAFHQAPLEYGGQGAILVLLAVPTYNRLDTKE